MENTATHSAPLSDVGGEEEEEMEEVLVYRMVKKKDPMVALIEKVDERFAALDKRLRSTHVKWQALKAKPAARG